MEPRPRHYPTGLGKSLHKIHTNLENTPVACLRQKYDIPQASDVTIFTSLPMGDIWQDAKLQDVFWYLIHNKRLQVPPLWVEPLRAFKEELREVL